MKRIVTAALAALGLIIAAAPAAASGNHWCHQGDPAILASASTSCSFAGNAYSDWVNQGTKRYWQGRSYSPVTHRRYLVTCRRTSHRDWWTNTVTCTGGNGIWFQTGMP
jgi:hypothetical protein